jgi:hypothetical protein
MAHVLVNLADAPQAPVGAASVDLVHIASAAVGDEEPASLGSDAGPPSPGAPASLPATLPEFIHALRLPLQEPLIDSTPIRRTSRRVSPVVPRRSTRIASMTHLRDSRPEEQAKKVMLRKWRPVARASPPHSPDASFAEKFHRTFKKPLSSSKRAALRELFPAGARRVAPLALDI